MKVTRFTFTEAGCRALLNDLHARGFDRSRLEVSPQGVVVKCSRCEALVINGTPTHEHGCINRRAECAECGQFMPARGHKVCAECWNF